MTDIHDRLDRLESRVEQQQATIEDQRETIRQQRERIADVEDDGGGSDGTRPTVSRRDALATGGLLALLFGGVGTASADPQGQVGTEDDPLTALYTEELGGGVTGTGAAISDLTGAGLSVESNTLDSSWQGADGDGLLEPSGPETGIDVSTVRTGTLEDADDNAHLTLTSGGPLGLNRTLDTGGNGITSPSALTLGTDNGTRALELGVPSADENGNTAGGNVVAGHPNNTVNNSAVGVVVGGGGANNGNENTVGGDYATTAGGRNNTASSESATVGGGRDNTANGRDSTVGGGRNNTADSRSATVAGGDGNEVRGLGDGATIGGGMFNRADSRHVTIGGGESNEVLLSGDYATIGGGMFNRADSRHVTIGGGEMNEVLFSGDYATIGGGVFNRADSRHVTIGGGEGNDARGEGATIGGGENNDTDGAAATVPGGESNTASGDQSFAAGAFAHAADDNAFVWNDGSGASGGTGASGDQFASDTADGSSGVTGAETFHVKAKGGVRMVTAGDNSSVTYIPAGGAGWNSTSTRAAKTAIDPVDPEAVLDGVDALDISTWEYGDDGDGRGVRHMGPMAEAFHEAFELGDSDRSINSVNADGVALAAIQGLSERLEDTRAELHAKDDRIEKLESDTERKDDRIEDLEAENERLRERVGAIESELGIGRTAG